MGSEAERAILGTAKLATTSSIALFTWSIQTLPLLASIEAEFTIVPPAAPAGAGEVPAKYLELRSNSFLFKELTVRHRRLHAHRAGL